MTKQRFFPFLAGFALALVFVLISAASLRQPTAYDVRKNTAEVEMVHGIYVFTDSKPVLEYQYIGKVEAFWIVQDDYETVRDEVVRLVKKKQKEANAVILHFSGSSFTGDAIKIEDSTK